MAAYAMLLAPPLVAQAPANVTRVTLVGTGGPELTSDRAGEATLVESNGQRLLFDAGRGVLDGLYRSRIDPQSVHRVFLTHLHSDHIEGLPGLWMTPWFLLGRVTPLELWGPPGTQQMVDGMRAMFAHDVQNRSNAVLRREALDIAVHEVQPGVAFDKEGVKVTAIAVEHADGDPAYAYLIETADARILLTGDCTYSEALATQAQPIDLVVSNVAAATPALAKLARVRPILAKLMTPEQAAMLFNRTRPRLAVYSHIVKKGLSGKAGDRIVLTRTRKAGYAGQLRMGEDHEQIVLSHPIRVVRIPSPTTDFDAPDSHFALP